MSLRLVLAAAALCAGTSIASADVVIVKGAPRDRGLAEGALAEAGKAMAVCWRAPTAGAVRVAVTVAGSGAVTAKAISKGGAAQCAAGILAVWTVPGGAWKGEVEIGGAASATPDLASTIQQQLLAKSGPIKACQAKAPGKAGNASIKMKIAADGSIGDVAVASKLGDELDKCVRLAVAAITIAPTGAAGAVSYQLNIAFSGSAAGAGGGGGGGGAGAGAGGDVAGSVGGGLDGKQIADGVARGRAAIGKCVDAKVARGRTAVVRFTIRPDGTVKNIVVKESSGDAKVDDCIAKAWTAITFPAAGEESKVNLPLQF